MIGWCVCWLLWLVCCCCRCCCCCCSERLGISNYDRLVYLLVSWFVFVAVSVVVAVAAVAAVAVVVAADKLLISC